jgi:DNA-directed RNA polymerase specialized sigma24 family protein
MISDGIENCLTAVEKFDPSRSSNPFAYYTQIIYFAFIRRIQKEKKQTATKYKMLENIDIDQIVTQSEDNHEMVNHLLEMVRRQSDLIDPDRKTIKGKPGRKKKVVEDTRTLDSN